MTRKILSVRWHPLRYHPEQARLWSDKKRFKVVVAGRRSGKTELAKRRLVTALGERNGRPDPRYFAAAPTRGQAKRIFWVDLKGLVPEKWIRRVYDTDLCIRTKSGAELWVAGLDKPQRIEGTPWDGGVLDEYANMKATVWSENIRPALSDRLGWCWFVGVPEGLNHYKDLADYAGGGGDPEWGLYRWSSADILPPSEVEAARRVLDPRTFRQEYEASFESATGRVYYAYSQETHMDPGAEFDKRYPVIVCCDFNVDPCVWVLVQSDGSRAWAFDEIVLRNTSTAEMARAVLQRYGRDGVKFRVYGDAAGSARSMTGMSDYAILHGIGLRDQRIRKSNPRIKDRVNAVNSLLVNTEGVVRFTHHPRCVELRRDFESVVWHEGFMEIDKGSPERTHASDALGYFVEYEFPLRINCARPGLRFYK